MCLAATVKNNTVIPKYIIGKSEEQGGAQLWQRSLLTEDTDPGNTTKYYLPYQFRYRMCLLSSVKSPLTFFFHLSQQNFYFNLFTMTKIIFSH